MNRYIDKETLIEQFDETCKYSKVTNEYQRGCNDVFDWMKKIIENAPTADVVEVRHGEWISESFISKTGEELYHTPMCSVCNQRTSFRTNFCPNCGAKMDGERKDDGN